MELNLLSATELIKRIRKGTVSVEEVCADCIGACRAREHDVKAWEYLDKELIMARARELDKKPQLGALAGIPIGIKDIFNTEDMPTAMGSPIWKDFAPGNDARVVHNIRMNDGLIFGKTVTAEFAVHYLPKNKTVNPHHKKRSPGTSSSGSAAAVASFMVPVSLGTQTAGSIIRPASYCGVFGFKPTFGTIPRTGMLKTTDSLDTIGFFARSIGDIKLMFDCVRVRGENYPFVFNSLDRPVNHAKKKINIGYIIDGIHVFDNFEKYAVDFFMAYVDRLKEGRNITVKKIIPSRNFNMIHKIHSTIYDKTLSYYFKEEFKKKLLISELIYNAIISGNRVSLDKYEEAVSEQARIRQTISKELNNFDIVITLSSTGIAPLIGDEESPDTCLIWTFLGYPALNIPKFTGPEKLPFGLQVVAKRYDDYNLLAAAEKILKV